MNVERPPTVSDEVAVIAAAEMFPENNPFPWTESICEGDVVPMPTLPPLVAKYAEPVLLITVVDAPPFAEKRPEVTVDDAFERKPFIKVARPVCVRVPV